ncbi:HAD family hydrolase [Endomicrobium proavitum]|uniref:Putative phosphatase/phosphohexomutase n=1 Tax=Endomicrobium proavitum TaxID=1408281 RepID=A0A0G3WIN7_9BACT|nr:HAD family phosphatase [Endomicrobium proavitum]AKL98501.1 putative phosphatase/phosphohexomutase [Endomicrobium proavitum]
MKNFNLKKFKAVFFDMDGVITDSMPYHFISWFEVLKKYNVRVAPTTIFEMEGAKWEKVIKLAFKESGKTLPKKLAVKIRFEREKIFDAYFKRFIFDGIEEFVLFLKRQGLFVGVVTGSSKTEAAKMLPKKLYKLFDTITAGDMVKKGKPFPDSYLLAAKNLNVCPAQCLVIENAPYGITAAKAAKMKCFAIATTLPKIFLQQADEIFNTHKDLYKYFKTH